MAGSNPTFEDFEVGQTAVYATFNPHIVREKGLKEDKGRYGRGYNVSLVWSDDVTDRVSEAAEHLTQYGFEIIPKDALHTTLAVDPNKGRSHEEDARYHSQLKDIPFDPMVIDLGALATNEKTAIVPGQGGRPFYNNVIAARTLSMGGAGWGAHITAGRSAVETWEGIEDLARILAEMKPIGERSPLAVRLGYHQRGDNGYEMETIERYDFKR